jgi:tetratricopeptide (TPR) repeat protein
VALLRQGHREKALVYLTRSIQSAPQAEAYWYRAQVYAELPRYRKQAIEDALKAFEMDPYKEKIVVFAAELLLEQGLVSKAKSVLEEGLKRMPEAKKLPELYREHFVRETEKSGVIHSLKNKLFRRKP